MKRLIVILFFFTGALSIFARQETLVKFYLEGGTIKQYNIEEIENISILTGKSGYNMLIYYQGSLKSEFSARDIETMKFEDDGSGKVLNIYISGSPNSFKITEIDSVSFIIKETSAPVITKLEPSSGLVGDELSIIGTDFGTERGSSFVSFNNANAEVYPQWSDTEIKVKVPAGAKSGLVSVTVNDKKSNEVQFTILTADKFQIISIQPPNAKIGDEITIKGTKLGSTRGTNYVTFNGAKANEYISWKDNEIKLKVPAGAKSGLISATVNGEKSNELNFGIIPYISSLSRNYAGISELITLTGTGFGDSTGTGKVNFNSISALNYPVWNDTSITAVIPPKAKSGKVSVMACGNKSNELNFQIIQHILQITPASARIGDTVTVSGTSFGEPRNDGIVAFRGANGSQYISWSDSLIKVIVPQGAKSGNVQVVTTDARQSNEIAFAITPYMISLTPALAKTGDEVTISGTGFGDSTGTEKATFYSWIYVTRFVKWSDNEIILKVPDDAENGYVYLTVNGVNSNQINFKVLPTITRLSSTTIKAGDKLTISGTGFNSSRGESKVTFNGAVGSLYQYWGNKSIEVTVPSGAQTGKVFVTTGGNNSNEMDLTITLPPVISGISPDSAGIGDIITINGSYFGDTRGTSVVNFKDKTGSDYTSWSSTQIKVKVPTGAKTGKLSVTVNGSKSNEVDLKIGSAAGNYEEVVIGTQTWMLKNLDITTYRNGDQIPEVTDGSQWDTLTTGAWCYYDNDPSNGEVYGKLYNWYAVNDPRGFAPLGWHVPTNDEWNTLANYLGGLDVAGGKLKETGYDHWDSPNTDATNESGFTALGGGHRYTNSGVYLYLKRSCRFWSSTIHYEPWNGYIWRLERNSSSLIFDWWNVKLGQSVRCVKD